jgi:hypothetical protein
MYQIAIYTKKEPWNKNKLVGQKRPLTLQQIWEIRVRLELNEDPKELALFNHVMLIISTYLPANTVAF